MLHRIVLSNATWLGELEGILLIATIQSWSSLDLPLRPLVLSHKGRDQLGLKLLTEPQFRAPTIESGS